MRTILGIAAATLLLFGVAGVESQAPSYYCGERLIRLGISIEDVPRVCGEPDSKLQRFGRRCSSDGEHRHCVATLIDEWVYDYGESRLKRRLTFVNARLVEVRTDGFGSTF